MRIGRLQSPPRCHTERVSARDAEYPRGPSSARPSRWWLALGAALLAVAVAVLAGGLTLVIRGVTSTDAVFPANGDPVQVSSPPGTTRMLFVPAGAPEPDCSVTDGSGTERLLDPVSGRARVVTRGGQWRGFASFDSGDGRLRVVCTSSTASQVRVGDRLGPTFAGGVVVTILLFLTLGGTGLAILVVTGRRYAAARRRR